MSKKTVGLWGALFATLADAPPLGGASRTSGHGLLTANATVFGAGFCVMVIELLAGRIIAGNLGSSLYTWTSVIGIVLAGLATGNYVGGRLADQHDSRRTLAVLFAASSAAAIFISIANNFVESLTFLWMMSWPWRVASHVALVFFLPACLLGMISPVVAKMALDGGLARGRTIGSLSAWGVVGSILGTFLTGFYLVDWLGTTTILMGVGGILAAIAVLYQRRSWKSWAWFSVVAVLCVVATGGADATRQLGERLGLRKALDERVIYYKESRYSYIKVSQVAGEGNSRQMHLDALLHSQIDLDRPLFLRYAYEKIFAAVTRRLHPSDDPVDHLMLGGGGYVYPRYMEETYPGSRNDVVEIDPEVTKAARATFGLPDEALGETLIRSFHEDARVYVDRLKREGSTGVYDLVYVDAFNHHNVPFQLTTLEFTQNVREILRPEGAYLINLIDTFDEALFLGAVVNTLSEVFPYVYGFVEGGSVRNTPQFRNTYVVVGMNRPFDGTNLSADCADECAIYPLNKQDMAYLKTKTSLILTDDYAPVENLLASIVLDHAKDRAFGDWSRSIRQAAGEGDFERAVELGRAALAAYPDKADNEDFASDLANLHGELGNALRLDGEYGAAEREYLAALKLDLSNIRARLGLIDCYRETDRLEESLPLFDGLLDFDPFVRYNYATALAQLGRLQEAVVEFEIVTGVAPDFADAYSNWGAALALLGEDQGAAEKLQRALELDPSHANALRSLARLQHQEGTAQ